MYQYFDSPYKEIPNELINEYTINKSIPILNWWLDGSKDLQSKIWDNKYINEYMINFTPEKINNQQCLNLEPYGGVSYLI